MFSGWNIAPCSVRASVRFRAKKSSLAPSSSGSRASRTSTSGIALGSSIMEAPNQYVIKDVITYSGGGKNRPSWRVWAWPSLVSNGRSAAGGANAGRARVGRERFGSAGSGRPEGKHDRRLQRLRGACVQGQRGSHRREGHRRRQAPRG